MEDHLQVGFVNRAVYALWLILMMRQGSDAERQTLRRWMTAHENDIMDQVIDAAVDQVESMYEEAVGS